MPPATPASRTAGQSSRQPEWLTAALDFALSPDLLDTGRINILERWVSQAAVEAFRGSGVSDDQAAEIRSASVAEYDVSVERSLTSEAAE